MNLLIVLLGNNSLANYALIKHFTTNNDSFLPVSDKVMIVFSKQTEIKAEIIKKFFKNINFIEVNIDKNNKDNSRDVSIIESIIMKELNKLNDVNSIHLNFTGGTSSMSVGAFEAVRNFKGCDDKDKFYSDIDNKHVLHFARGEIYPLNGSISDKLEFSIEDFAILENFTILNLRRNNSQFFSLDFYKFLLNEVLKKETDFFESWDDCKDEKDVKNCEKYFKLWEEQLENFINFDSLDENDIFELIRFVRGVFLEEYVFYILKKYKEEFNLKDIAWNVEIKNFKNKKFEVDVVVTKGADVYVFSCTTDKYEYLKQKSFEAIARANHIGGYGAKPILVSCANKKKVKGNLKEMIDRENKNSFDMIGREELLDENKLLEKLKAIFK